MEITKQRLEDNFIKNTTDLLIRNEIFPYVDKLYTLIKDVDCIIDFCCYGCQDYPFLEEDEITNELVIVLYCGEHADLKIEINPFTNNIHYSLYNKNHYVNSGDDVFDNIVEVIEENHKLINI